MKKLLKQYNFISDMQYGEMCVESYINGQIQQAKDQFNAMPKANKKAMVRAMFTNWGGHKAETKLFFFDLL